VSLDSGSERLNPFELAQDNLTFLLSLVPYLIERHAVTVAEAAAHFEVSADQIRDAVKLIAVSGVPGDSNNYQHGDLFDIDWDALEQNDEIIITQLVAIDDSPRFSAREAAALIAGLQYLQTLPENTDSATYSLLAAKLLRGASDSPSQVAVAPLESNGTVAILRAALSAGEQVEFDYMNSRGDRERRTVDPLRIDSDNNDWYLRGWCHLRESIRTFRLDRIDGLTRTGAPIAFQPSDVRLSDSLFEISEDHLRVVLEFPRESLSLLGDFVPEGARFRKMPDGLVRTTVRVAHFDGLKRLVASLAGVVAVVSPPEARAAVSEWVADASAQYANDGISAGTHDSESRRPPDQMES
jgi:proteasome accessory factor C